MILKNLMEEKQLDFNQPLLSVRRFSSKVVSQNENKKKSNKTPAGIPPLPYYKSELKSGPVRIPGMVPFVWEQTPGRPKDESKSLAMAPECAPVVPNLPPGKLLKAEEQDSDKVLKTSPVTYSQMGNACSNSQYVSPMDKKVTEYERLKEKVVEKSSSGSNDGEEAYVDALDILSRTESFFMNFSVTGLSGFDDTNSKTSVSFSTNPQAREFMMDRFLPAAKAMASELPQYVKRKPTGLRAQAPEVREVMNEERQHQIRQHIPNVFSHYREERQEFDDYDESDNYRAKVCGLFPRFCLLNPLPGMRMHESLPLSPAHRLHAKASYSEIKKEHARKTLCESKVAGGTQGTELNVNGIGIRSVSNQYGHESGSEKLDRSSPYRRLQCNGTENVNLRHLLEEELLEEENCSIGSTEKSHNISVNSIDPHGRERRSFGELLANDDTEGELGTVSPIPEKTLYIDSINATKSYSGTSSPEVKDQIYHGEDESETYAKDSEMEKNPSIDSSLKDCEHSGVMNKKEILGCKSLESLNSSFLSCSDRSDFDVHVETNGFRDKDSIQDLSTLPNSEMAGNFKFILENKELPKSENQFTSCVAYQDSGAGWGTTDIKSQVTNNQEISSDHNQDYISLRCSNVAYAMKTDEKIMLTTKSSNQETSNVLTQDSNVLAGSRVTSGDQKIYLDSQCLVKLGNPELRPLGPPLPKSPSDSWLKRTLPTISSKNAVSWSSLATQIHPGSQTLKAASLDPRWETIVKCSNLNHGHLRFGEELTPIPEA